MSTLLIIYASSMGNTRRMAEAVAAGAKEIDGVEALLRTAEEARVEDVRRCDALVLGSPVRHGNADSRLRRFIESDCESLVFRGALQNKLGAVFTVGGHFGRHGDGGEVAQLALLRSLATAGMTLVSAPGAAIDPLSSGPHWGPHARLRMRENGNETLQPDMLAIARAHGRRIAQLAQALRGQRATSNARSAWRWPRMWYRLAGVFR